MCRPLFGNWLGCDTEELARGNCSIHKLLHNYVLLTNLTLLTIAIEVVQSPLLPAEGAGDGQGGVVCGAGRPPGVQALVVDGAATLSLAPPKLLVVVAHALVAHRAILFERFLIDVLDIAGAAGGAWGGGGEASSIQLLLQLLGGDFGAVQRFVELVN